jgi:Ribbon-helix-helix protein, copG family
MKTHKLSIKKKRPGRPPTGINPAVGVRLPPKLLRAVDHWRARQSDVPGRPEAIRRLIETALEAIERRRT